MPDHSTHPTCRRTSEGHLRTGKRSDRISASFTPRTPPYPGSDESLCSEKSHLGVVRDSSTLSVRFDVVGDPRGPEALANLRQAVELDPGAERVANGAAQKTSSNSRTVGGCVEHTSVAERGSLPAALARIETVLRFYEDRGWRSYQSSRPELLRLFVFCADLLKWGGFDLVRARDCGRIISWVPCCGARFLPKVRLYSFDVRRS
jgi:hypothetical protein